MHYNTVLMMHTRRRPADETNVDPIAAQYRLARQARSIASLNDAFAAQAGRELDFVEQAELHVEGLIFHAIAKWHTMLAETASRLHREQK